MHLQGKRAVVTGAARGIGRGIAIELARAGCDVAIGDLMGRDEIATAAEETVSAVESLGRRAVAFSCDVSREEDCEALMQGAADALGGIDIVVCNAGIMQLGGLAEITSEQWRTVLDVNLTGAFQSCRAALPHLEAAGGGAIVNIASTTGLRGASGRIAYTSSKFGVVGLTESLADELADRGIRVNCVCPAFVRSNMSIGELMTHSGISDAEKADAAWTKVGRSMGRLGRSVEPDDIGRAVVWLCESDMVVGIALPVTGGDDLPK